jgi:hypothetical protein
VKSSWLIWGILFLFMGQMVNADKFLWQIGQTDGSGGEFALAPADYPDYSEKFPNGCLYAVGRSSAANDWSYVLPGHRDHWAGNRPGQAVIVFGLDKLPQSAAEMKIVFVSSHPTNPPLVHVRVNTFEYQQRLTPGGADACITGSTQGAVSSVLSVKVPVEALRLGSNYIFLSNLEGSWTIFDGISFAAEGAALRPVQERPEILDHIVQPSILRGPEGQGMREVRLSIAHMGQSATFDIVSQDRVLATTTLHKGLNSSAIQIPAGSAASLAVSVRRDDQTSPVREIAIAPVRQWTVNLTQATHTDIGYTRPQTEILSEHLRYIDLALDYCDLTDDYPAESQFKWVCEVTWPVNEYLRSRPAQQVERLRQRIRQGRIEVAGMYLNFDELPDEQTLAWSLKPIANLRAAGIPVKAAMQNDVNGIGWCFNDYFASLGVRYLNMGVHGHKALVPFALPTAFWWESPGGSRMLAFRAEHYHFGNTRIGICRGDFEAFERNMLNYLNQLEDKGYPFDQVLIQYSGYLMDNAPPSIKPLQMITQWNAKYLWPQLRTALLSDFFEAIEEKHGDTLAVHHGAWPDWWTDGFGSAAREMAAARQAHAEIIAAQSGLAMAHLLDMKLPSEINHRVDLVQDALLFYGEHTFGAAESIREPFGNATLQMRRLKESYAWEAWRRADMVKEEALGLLQAQVPVLEKPSIVFFNTLPFARSGWLTIYLNYDFVPRGRQISLRDENGTLYPTQILKGNHDTYGVYRAVWAPQIPAFGFRQFTIEETGAASESAPDRDQSQFENAWYRLTVDRQKATLTSLFDKELGKELVDPDAAWGMGQFIHEILDNRLELDRFYLKSFQRNSLTSVVFDGFHPGNVWDTIRFRGRTDAADPQDGFSLEIRLMKHVKQIDFAYMIRKKLTTDPEGIYIAFPFALDSGKIYADVPGGVMLAGVEQIPGSSNDWNKVQNFAAVRNERAQILLGSPQAPLMQFGNINTGRFKAGALPESTHIFGWPMNTYWVTNFNADQHGEFHWRYYFSSAAENDMAAATRFGWANRVPLMFRVLPGGKDATGGPAVRSVLEAFPDNVLLVSAQLAAKENAVVLHLRETGGKAVEFMPQTGNRKLKLRQVDVLGNPLQSLNVIALKPYEMQFVEISF